MVASSSPIAPSTRYRLKPTGCPTCLRPRSLTTDRPLSLRSTFIRATKIERQYAARLRTIAGHIGDLVRAAGIQDLPGASRLQDMLNRYAQALTPWAEAVGSRMIAEVAQHDARSWRRLSAIMGEGIRQEIAQAPTGAVMQKALADQVRLITSLPREAGERVHDLTIKGISAGTRADVVAAEILRTGEVTKARAELIARTETSRTATALTRARAEHVGSVEFVWRTAGDSDVRPGHRKLNGRTFRWDDPPECDPGHHALPGAIWNCRCYPEAIIPEA